MVVADTPAGALTLSTFKQLVNRSGGYRYYFKMRDPDFGSVRTELSKNEALLPIWDGRVVAWMESAKQHQAAGEIIF